MQNLMFKAMQDGQKMAPAALDSFSQFLFLLLLYWLPASRGQGPTDKAAPGEPTLSYKIQEERQVGTMIGNIRDDARAFFNVTSQADINRMSFVLLNSSIAAPGVFAVDQRLGTLTVTSRVDRDVICAAQVTCVVTLTLYITAPPQAKLIKVDITIDDMNDNSPFFNPSQLTQHLSESLVPPVEDLLPLPVAQDADSPPFNGAIAAYRLLPENSTSPFRLRSQRGPGGLWDLRLTLVSPLDREVTPSYKLSLVAYDAGVPSRSGSLEINILVDDMNDNEPRFEESVYVVRVRDDAVVGTVLVRVKATDADLGPNAQIKYQFAPRSRELYGRQFTIGSDTGEVVLAQPLAHAGLQGAYNLSVQALDGGPNGLPAAAALLITVHHVNVQPPRITVDSLSDDGLAKVDRSSPAGSFVARVNAVDPDGAPNSGVPCTLSAQDDFSLVALSGKDYKIVTARSFQNVPISTRYQISISCVDLDQPPLTSVQTLTVTLMDTPSPPPLAFSAPLYSVVMTTGVARGVVLVTVRASDVTSADRTGAVRYSLADASNFDRFSLDPSSGSISTAAVLNIPQLYEFSILATRQPRGASTQSTAARVRVSVILPENFPASFLAGRGSFDVAENLPAGTEVGRVGAVAPTESPRDTSLVIYSIIDEEIGGGPSSQFQIDGTGLIRTLAPLDAELCNSFALHVTACMMTSSNIGDMTSSPVTSSGLMTSFVTSSRVWISVVGVNDNAPVVLYPAPPVNDTVVVAYDLGVGEVVTTVVAVDRDVDERDRRLTYALIGGGSPAAAAADWFEVSRTTGEVRLKADLSGRVNETIPLRVNVTDGRYNAAVAFKVVVSDLSLAALRARSTSQTGMSSDTRVIILACVLSAALVLVCLIATAILLLCRRRRRHNKGATKSAPSGGGTNHQNPVYWTSVDLHEGAGTGSEGEERGVGSEEEEEGFRIRNQLEMLEEARRKKAVEAYKQNYQRVSTSTPPVVTGAAPPARLDGSSDSSDSGCADAAGSQASSEDGGAGESKRSSKSSENGVNGEVSPRIKRPQQFNLVLVPPQPPATQLLAPPSPFNSVVPDWLRAANNPSHVTIGSLERQSRKNPAPGIPNQAESQRMAEYNLSAIGPPSYNGAISSIQSTPFTTNGAELTYPADKQGNFGRPGENHNLSNLSRSSFGRTGAPDVTPMGRGGPVRASSPIFISRPSPEPSPSPVRKSSLIRPSSGSRRSSRFDEGIPGGGESGIFGGVGGGSIKRVHFAEHNQMTYLERTSVASDVSGGSDVASSREDISRDDVSRTSSSDTTSADYDVTSGAIGRGGGGREESYTGSSGRVGSGQLLGDSLGRAGGSLRVAAGPRQYDSNATAFGVAFRPEDGSLV